MVYLFVCCSLGFDHRFLSAYSTRTEQCARSPAMNELELFASMVGDERFSPRFDLERPCAAIVAQSTVKPRECPRCPVGTARTTIPKSVNEHSSSSFERYEAFLRLTMPTNSWELISTIKKKEEASFSLSLCLRVFHSPLLEEVSLEW